MEFLNDFHNILFNAHILFSIALGIWAGSLAIRNQQISGNYWGAVATITILAAAVLVVGVIMSLTGLTLRSGRATIYFLYMAWLVVIMPGLFSLLRGRDDRNAAVSFAVLSFFNASTSFSMWTRELVGPWVTPEV
ncbi:MAG: hypothetical protein GYB67_01375 [Chloroflexi bacterium]|nr:hypothetical protein [Chloroflexota bacterium]